MKCRLLIDPPATGSWNMALDEAILETAAQLSVATFRLYRWNAPTLSLGYFQKHTDRTEHTESRNAPLVRRSSGGGAILHDQELTYSLTIPAGHQLIGHPEELYKKIHRSLIEMLAEYGVRAKLCKNGSTLRQSEQPFLCFERRATGDVLLAAEPGLVTESYKQVSLNQVSLKQVSLKQVSLKQVSLNQVSLNQVSLNQVSLKPDFDYKIIGSAQRRKQGSILQHGSILLEQSSAAPQLPGISQLANVSIRAEEFSRRWLSLLGPVFSSWGLEFEAQGECSAVEIARAAEIEKNKYGAESWTELR